MKYIGYGFLVFSVQAFYQDKMMLGAILLMIGGVLSRGFSWSLSSFAHVSLISLVVYSLTHEYAWETIFMIVAAMTTILLTRSGGGFWEIPFYLFEESSDSEEESMDSGPDYSSLSSGSSGFFGGGDGGGDSGGGDGGGA